MILGCTRGLSVGTAAWGPAVARSASARLLRAFMHAGTLLVLLLMSLRAFAADADLPDVPAPAAAAHYVVRTFSSSNFRAAEVDVENSGKRGFSWYPFLFFGSHPRLESLVLNRDGSITLLGDTTGPNGELATARVIAGPDKFVGKAFGGGAYFVATFRFDPRDVLRTDFRGWPAWWSMAVEHMARLDTRQWPGQPDGYEHFIEADFFEYDLKDYVKGGSLNYFGGALRDWFGYEEKLEPVPLWSRLFVREVPADTDFTQYHRYGFLWVPATAEHVGYGEYYFDDQKIGARLEWEWRKDEIPPPRAPSFFNIIDRDHLVLILGTGPDQPMTVKSVNVWQASEERNLSR